MWNEYENPVDQQIKQIDAYISEAGISESRLGQLACANQYVIGRIRTGNARIESLRQVLDYIMQNPVSLPAKKSD